jgi:hypothetical protein
LTDPPADIGLNFGKLYLETYNPKGNTFDPIPLIPEARDPDAIWVTRT